MNDAWWEVSNADEIPTPSLLVYPDRISTNLDMMIAWSGSPHALRPHVKTHKLAEIVKLKLSKGITKFKTATIAESEMVAEAGGEDVLLAMQPVGFNLRRYLTLCERFPNVRFSTVVDDASQLRQMHELALSRQQVLRLFLDLNVGMNRTGIAIGDEARSLYREMTQLGTLENRSIEVEGFHAYDGHLHIPNWSELVARSNETFGAVLQFRDLVEADGCRVPLIVTSGTPTSPVVGARRLQGVEISAGTTVLWDFGQQDTCPTMQCLNAAVLLTRVVSRPTPTRICIDLGHKAVASEFPHPRARFYGLEDASPVLHSEEHLVLESDRAGQYPVGTVVYGIPKHICPTVALHSHVWVVRNGRAEETWRVVARDRMITI